MRRVRRIIRRTRRVHARHQDAETQGPFEQSFRTDYSDQPPIRANTVYTPLFKLDDENRPRVKPEKAPRKPTTDYVSLAIKAGKEFNQKTSLERIDEIAKDLFKFDIDPHVHVTMPNLEAQEIFDWIVTLKDRPMFEQKRLKLAREFIASLASESSPAVKQDAS